MTGFDDFLAAVDRDRALAETRAQALSRRRRFPGLSAAGAVFALAGGTRADAALVKTDVDILNFALVLEYLQASFYTEAEQNGALVGTTARAPGGMGPGDRPPARPSRTPPGARPAGRRFCHSRGTPGRGKNSLVAGV